MINKKKNVLKRTYPNFKDKSYDRNTRLKTKINIRLEKHTCTDTLELNKKYKTKITQKC